MKSSPNAPPFPAKIAAFMADENRQTLTLSDGLSASKMTPEEEIFAYVAAQQPHLAVVEQKDGVIRTEIAPNRAEAYRALKRLLETSGGNWSCPSPLTDGWMQEASSI